MKQLFFIQLLLVLLSSNAIADTINVGDITNIHVADQFVGSSSSGAACEASQTAANCDFLQTFTSNYLNDAMLGTIVTSDYSTSVKSPNTSNAYIDLAFTEDMFNGDGNDLVLFFVGNSTAFNLDVFTTDDNENSIFSETHTINMTTDLAPITTSEGTGWICISAPGEPCSGIGLSAVLFDLGDSVAGDVALGRLRISFGDAFIEGTTSSNFSLAGGFHNQATVSQVPLPLPAILFGSGLALLGMVARKKKS